ncbi:DUF4326 domain-containing protein [Sphingobium sp. LMA1-1-1.1]|uniref:DUF4326 domain-containing protein n=1 Tax=Sphingobium sp. LMA1-1-1.1 TaxID=3135238 RepID=UPI003442575E
MDKPVRVQLSRAKGWRMPANTVKVDRSTKWGNPYPVEGTRSAAMAVAAFRLHILATPALREMAHRELAGKNLACWCQPSEPCHADVLLEIANG